MLDIGQHGALQEVSTHNEERNVCEGGDNRGVCHDLDRRTVDKDIVIVLTKLLDSLTEAIFIEQFSGIRREHTHGNHIEFNSIIAVDDFAQFALSIEVAGNTHLRLANVFRCSRLTHIEVDHDNALLLECKTHGQVHGQESLTRSGVGRNHHCNDTTSILFRTELKVRTQYAEGFVDIIVALRLNDNVFARNVNLRTANPQFLENTTPN